MVTPREEEDPMSAVIVPSSRRTTQRAARLQSLVTRLSDADLVHPMPAGWTVAGVLAHLAFWDQRILDLLERWEQSPSTVPRGLNQADGDWINDAMKPLLIALAPRRAAELAVAIANAADGKVAALSDDFLVRNEAAGRPLNLLRAEHRRQHLQESSRSSADAQFLGKQGRHPHRRRQRHRAPARAGPWLRREERGGP